MATVELRPGDILNIVWSSVQETPLGVKEVESNFAFSYDELLLKLRAKGKGGKARRSGTNGAKFSRIVALTYSALQKGHWSTGATIDKEEVFSKLLLRFKELPRSEYLNLTDNALKALTEISNSKKLISAEQKEQLKLLLEEIRPFKK